MPSMAASHGGVLYYVVKVPRDEVHGRVESGWDNPFRPGGDLSREADEIVEMIKGGKPITPTSGGNASPSPPGHHQDDDIPDSNDPLLKQQDINSKKTAAAAGDVVSDKVNSRPLTSTPKSAKNGSANAKDGPNNNAAAAAKKSDPVDVQRGTAGQPGDASQVEHIVIKKKPKCKCCVIQ
ncbi:PREDICTED: uncharacterized protein LOC108559454 [Nicrophorus vespilloides]|uniref:Uncharacterized protein LOC108559454 n=1 Tax=Nicrophorus vespilloides TaxID=110193 RepID=A0ABM1MCE1_NICVS|nr:PREDICTED: uncharacterized protein LOC108559454 [Nicrophorus vespilloides]XP_017772240.1 PREDICTED: uncharacterized protein LOC108559454 [Nicrophorus vespilloides]XP_017772241.1 PREDICTED: uncharacterized protein LOC108559454 [Nicrophorus vespilloides]